MSNMVEEDKTITAQEEWLSTLKKIQKIRENNGETLFDVGFAYRNNKNDDTKAFSWFYKAALENYDKAQVQVGYMYQCGLGVSQDYNLALEWYQKPASNGNTNAQNSIGEMYERLKGQINDAKEEHKGEEQLIKLFDSKMKIMQDAFESRLGLIEKANRIVLNNLQQEQTRKDEEIKQPKEKLARLETDLNRIIGNGDKNNDN